MAGPRATDGPLRDAIAALDTLRSATNADAAHKAWLDFLHAWSRGLNKSDAVGRKRLGKNWASIAAEVEADPLLHYLRVARGADEHTVEPVAHGRDPAFVVTGQGRFNAELRDGVFKLWQDPTAPEEHRYRAEIKPPNVDVLPIRSRSGILRPPTEHRGRPLPDRAATTLAALALQYLHEVAERAYGESEPTPA
jgi:hypothetical protein